MQVQEKIVVTLVFTPYIHLVPLFAASTQEIHIISREPFKQSVKGKFFQKLLIPVVLEEEGFIASMVALESKIFFFSKDISDKNVLLPFLIVILRSNK